MVKYINKYIYKILKILKILKNHGNSVCFSADKTEVRL